MLQHNIRLLQAKRIWHTITVVLCKNKIARHKTLVSYRIIFCQNTKYVEYIIIELEEDTTITRQRPNMEPQVCTSKYNRTHVVRRQYKVMIGITIKLHTSTGKKDLLKQRPSNIKHIEQIRTKHVYNKDGHRKNLRRVR